MAILYRREKEDMPAYRKRSMMPKRKVSPSTPSLHPKKIVIKDGKVAGVECARMSLGKFDKGGRRTPEAIPGSEFVVDADLVIAAIGQTPDLSWVNGDGIKTAKGGTVEVNVKTLATAKDGVFAAGDNVRGPATAVEAVGDGKTAAMAIDKYLGGDGEPMNAYRDELVSMVVTYDEAQYQKELGKVAMPHLPLSKRSRNFNEVVLGYRSEGCSGRGQEVSALLPQGDRITLRR